MTIAERLAKIEPHLAWLKVSYRPAYENACNAIWHELERAYTDGLDTGLGFKQKGKETAMPMDKHATAIRVLDEKFATITDMTFLTADEQDAMLALVDDAVGILMMRGRTREIQLLAARFDKMVASARGLPPHVELTAGTKVVDIS